MSYASLQKGAEKIFAKPVPGLKVGVCVDWWIKDNVPSRDGLKTRVYFLFEINEQNPDYEDGRPFLVRIFFGYTLSDRGKLCPFLMSWMGRPIPEGADIIWERFVRQPCQLTIIHAENASNPEDPWVNIQSIVPLAEGMAKPVPSQFYTRYKDRENFERRTEYGIFHFGDEADTPVVSPPAPVPPASAPIAPPIGSAVQAPPPPVQPPPAIAPPAQPQTGQSLASDQIAPPAGNAPIAPLPPGTAPAPPYVDDEMPF